MIFGMNRVSARLTALWRAVWRSELVDREMHEEMRFHVDLEAERLMREQQLTAQEARRRAHAAFGGIEKYRAEGRATGRLHWIDAVSLDWRLAVRMLAKHRGLTLVGGFAMAISIAIGATFFELLSEAARPLPLDEGDRIVALVYATPTPGSVERRVLHDLADWRDGLRSVQHLSAFRTDQYNLVTGLPPYEPVFVAEISASGFVVARTPPLLGRYLVPGDEREGAPPVVVIGYQPWQTRFAADPGVVGRTINLNGTPTTVVGVMPEGFRFPVDHHYWVPLQTNPLRYERLQGPRLNVFGRLAPGHTLEQAQAEFTAVGQRIAATRPDLYKGLRSVVVPYTHEQSGLTEPMRLWLLRIVQLFVGGLTLVVAVNLAILVYARTVTRLGEIAVRTALGASRRRILVQLFIESLALSLLGAAAGLLIGDAALARLRTLVGPLELVAFWVDFELSAGTIAYALALASCAALVMGVLPGLKATSSRVSLNLRELDSRSGARLGPMWTTLVVAQVAVAVAVLPLAVYLTWQVVQMGIAGPEFAAEKFVVGIVAMGDEASVDRERISSRQLQLVERLQAEPGVSAVTFSSGVPGFAPGRLLRFEPAAGLRYAVPLGVDVLDVDAELFTAYNANLIAGRAFTSSDPDGTPVVVVNRSFADHFLTGSPLGVRFRYLSPYERPGTRPETSYEVVGVVDDFPRFPPEPGSDGQPVVYHPVAPGTVHPVALSVRFARSVPEGFTDRFRAIAVEVDPALQMRQVSPLPEFYDRQRSFWRYLAWGVALVTLSVLMLSAAGIYAMMSFTVAQRTREIAIRAALGAGPRHLMLNIFGRAAGQLSLGVAVGSVLAVALFQNVELATDSVAAYVLTVAAAMAFVGLLAAGGPARRGLRIQANDALRADA
jgi:predicted permease